MPRSEYVTRLLRELETNPPPRLRRVLESASRPRKPLPLRQPRSETIGAIGTLYVRKIRSKGTSMNATWFDVAKAYCDGWADAESIAPKRGVPPTGTNDV